MGLVSAKTGYGIEDLITKLLKEWKRKGKIILYFALINLLYDFSILQGMFISMVALTQENQLYLIHFLNLIIVMVGQKILFFLQVLQTGQVH